MKSAKRQSSEVVRRYERRGYLRALNDVLGKCKDARDQYDALYSKRSRRDLCSDVLIRRIAIEDLQKEIVALIPSKQRPFRSSK